MLFLALRLGYLFAHVNANCGAHAHSCKGVCPEVRRALLTRVAGDSTGELRSPSEALDAAVWAAVELRRVRPPPPAAVAA